MSEDITRDFLAQLAAECPDAIVYADADGEIRFWNAAATRIFGFDESEALGARLDLVIPERLRPRHWEGYGKVMGGAPSRYAHGALLAVPALHKDGRQLSIEFTILPRRDAGGRLIGVVAFLRDATARFEEMRALRRELAALKA
ncbi:MAG TPA: PAS domain S-box protein [Stellaceae bacterium]|jgi:PAS domain S-box-containing protein|nr:PAS domain S-box protein [Stellaceae bacterium]